jgi:bifunctional ADP-heptose synthase (sugar kinase/adenylyltransferase)
VTYLEQARAQGDRLIVAVNDDASVSRLKGPAGRSTASTGAWPCWPGWARWTG